MESGRQLSDTVKILTARAFEALLLLPDPFPPLPTPSGVINLRPEFCGYHCLSFFF